ncbi:TonB-dependent receptor [Sphingomonas sp. Leaf33]|uniref:TonB-dependent receptor n=1 Tax=Sphingomonas sp. Leaf33 TaxID=1736215 RepID=UPI0006F2DFF0|nr:TonB-dependent receptor [Sphingomonas sp. Leaf33]KQN26315.1 TonB-dependent receptor [Sphingomonas sp. Leaf33]
MAIFTRRHRIALAVTTATLSLVLAEAAHAQAAPETNVEKDARAPGNQQSTDAPPASATVAADETAANEVVVTGFRESLNTALNIKRNQTATVDAIKAEDIAEFPDLNLAESLQRIPGVAISRVNGEGRNISVRGLGPEYTRVRINGMEAIGTTGGTDNSGGVNRGRGFDFNIFSSDLFNSLAVRKTATADVEEGSLGATVDLQTSRPFDYKKPTAVLSAQVSYNDLARKPTPRLSGLVTASSKDGRFGVLLSMAYEERKLYEEGANITRWTYGGFNGGFNPASTLAGYTVAQINYGASATQTDYAGQALFHPRIPGLVNYTIDQQRLGAAGSIQFQPTSATLISIDGLYSRLDGSRAESQLQAISFSRSGTGKPQTIIRSGTVDGDRNIVSGVFDQVDVRSQSRFDILRTDFYQGTINLDQKFGERLKFVGTAGYAKSAFSNPIQTTVTIDAVNSNNFVYDFSTRFPLIKPGFDVTNVANYTFANGTSEVRVRPQTVDNSFKTAKGYLEFEVIPAIKLKGGLDWREFNYASTEGRRNAGETVVQTLTGTQLAAATKLYSGFGRGLDLPAGTPTAWVVPDLAAFETLYGIYTNPLYAVGRLDNATARGSFITVRERDTGAWAMTEFNLRDMGLPIRGDAGLRYVKTDQLSTGYAGQGTSISQVVAERNYDRWLPSGNIVADLTDTLLVRFGAAKTLARAGIASLTPGGNLNISGSNRGFSSGNPDLKPTESTNLDLSVEWYPTRGAVYAVSGFQKDITTFVQTLSVNVPFADLGLPASLLAGSAASANDVFTVTQPVNSSGGKLRGFEVNIQQPFTFLGGIFRNFGVLANYTHVSSNIRYLLSATSSATVTQPLVGLSKHAANGTLYYEDKKFSIRGSVAYRSKYLTAVPGTEGNSYNGTNSTLNVDAQASYSITDQLKISLEAINLTDQKNDQYVDVTNRLNVLTHSGRQYTLGARFAF